MRKRSDKAKKMRGHRWSKPKLGIPGPPCFVCGQEVIGRGVPLLVGHTAHTKTGLPTKIGQLMGDGFMIVVTVEDMLCKRCATLINHLDKLETDLDDVKASLMSYLKMKYQLADGNEEEQINGEEYISVEDGSTVLEHLKTEIAENSDGVSGFNCDGKDDGSGSEWEGGVLTKKVNVEIILDERHSQRRNLQTPSETQLYNYECSRCGFGSNEFKEIEQHPAICMHYQHACSICGKMFETNKHVQNHIMQAHLSKWTCHFCGTTFNEEEEFTAHMRVHVVSNNNQEICEPLTNSVGNFECNICGFECTKRAEFDDHLRKHVILKLFKCKECGKRFEDEHSLDEHCLSHKTVDKCDNICSLIEDSIMEHIKIPNRTSQDMTGDIIVWPNKENFLQPSRNLVENSELVKSVGDENECVHASQSEGGMKFQTCPMCSLTFLNGTLYEQHMKNHSESALSSSSKDDMMDHESSLMSSLVDSHNYVDSVIGSSLEDMFEKMHAQVGSTENKHINSFVQESGECSKDIFRCDINTDDILKSSVDVSTDQRHCTLRALCGGSENSVKKLITNDPSMCLKTESVSSSNILSANQISDSFCVSSPISVISPLVNSSGSKPVTSIDQVTLESIYSVRQEKNLEETDLVNNAFDEACGTSGSGLDGDDSEDMLPSFAEVETFIEEKQSVKKTYVCAVCGFKCMDMPQLKEHFSEHKNSGINQCTICNKFFPSKVRLKKHLKAHENTLSGKMTCPNCYDEFPDYFHLFQHMQDKHQKEKIIYKCEFCNQKFTSRKSYKAHEETHPERFEFKCDECDQTFMKEKQLKDHKDATHRDPHCRYCGKEILKLKTLRNHEMRHLRDKDNFECDVCKRVFKTKTGLRHHVAVHTGEYKYCCDYCGRGFMSRMMMEEHRSMHTKEERYVCDVCGRKFSFQSTYWIHRKWHDNPYPYKCSYCNRMFRHSSLLAVHKRKHTGERPYKCPHCPLTFPVGGTLKRHLILHTGVYPFNCESCKRGFTTRHKYATHLAKIHGDYELLNSKQPQGEYKMVIRDEPKQGQEIPVWTFPDDTDQNDLNFKLEVAGAADSIEQMEAGIPCSIVGDDLLVDSGVAARVVEIVLDDESQAVATVTLAEPSPSSILPELWYQ